MRGLLIVAAAVGLAGCGPTMLPVLTMQGETPESRDRDVTACRYEGTRAASGLTLPNAFIAASDRRTAEDRVYRACMMARGYREELRPMTFGEFLSWENEGRNPQAMVAPLVK